MSKLEVLIEKLCPNGVEYKSIDELLKLKKLLIVTPSFKVKKNEYRLKGKIPIVSQEIEKISGYYDDFDKNIPKDKYICFGDHSEHIKFIDFSFVQGADGLKIIKTNDENNNAKFIFYAISNNYNRYNNYERHFKYLCQVKIPVPPIEVQNEIVRILDNFTELEAELEAELETRKKQYNFYLNYLLKFNRKDVKFMSVGELFEIRNGLNKEKSAFGKGKPIINFTDVYNKRWLNAKSFKGLVDVSQDEIERYSAKKGDVFFTRTSETKEDIGMSSTLIEDVSDCVFSGFVLRARPITNLLLPKFCAYYFSTNVVRKTIIRYAAFTTRATTTGPKLSKIMVPILPIEEQEKIVSILDRFDKLCNDITEGLPAEIEARRKQYEYYRDKLLNFKELKVENKE